MSIAENREWGGKNRKIAMPLVAGRLTLEAFLFRFSYPGMLTRCCRDGVGTGDGGGIFNSAVWGAMGAG